MGETVEIYADTRKAGECNTCHHVLVFAQTTRDEVKAFNLDGQATAARLHTTNGRLILKMKVADIHDCNKRRR